MSSLFKQKIAYSSLQLPFTLSSLFNLHHSYFFFPSLPVTTSSFSFETLILRSQRSCHLILLPPVKKIKLTMDERIGTFREMGKLLVFFFKRTKKGTFKNRLIALFIYIPPTLLYLSIRHNYTSTSPSFIMNLLILLFPSSLPRLLFYLLFLPTKEETLLTT